MKYSYTHIFMHNLLQLNYQYLKKCVESGPITPMQKEWSEHILTMIPEKLQMTVPLKEVISELFEEIKEDYTGSMKKSMGKYYFF